MLAAGVVFIGTHLVRRGVPGIARLNMNFVFLAMLVARLLLREHRRLTRPSTAETRAGGAKEAT
jgi:hypothetical protein